jgi:hypothetical protein
MSRPPFGGQVKIYSNDSRCKMLKSIPGFLEAEPGTSYQTHRGIGLDFPKRYGPLILRRLERVSM